MLWKGFQKPKRLEVDQETPDRRRSGGSTPSRSSAASARRSATRCAASCCRRSRARRSPRSRSRACCTSSPRFPGVVEDTTDIILNLKQIPFRIHSDHPETLTLDGRGAGHGHGRATSRPAPTSRSSTRASTSRRCPRRASSRWRCGSSAAAATSPADRNFDEDLGIGYIPIDSVHSPVRKVNYTVEDARLGQTTDYDKLILEVWTNGAVTPQDAVAMAAKLLKDHMAIFINFEEAPEEELDFPTTEDERLIEQLEPLGGRAGAVGPLLQLPEERRTSRRSATWCPRPRPRC